MKTYISSVTPAKTLTTSQPSTGTTTNSAVKTPLIAPPKVPTSVASSSSGQKPLTVPTATTEVKPTVDPNLIRIKVIVDGTNHSQFFMVDKTKSLKNVLQDVEETYCGNTNMCDFTYANNKFPSLDVTPDAMKIPNNGVIVATVKKIMISLLDQSGERMNVKINLNTPMAKVMDAYAGHLGQPATLFQFQFDWKVFKSTDTPAGLKMKDDDVIYVFQKEAI